jgi:hypothetical protein
LFEILSTAQRRRGSSSSSEEPLATETEVKLQHCLVGWCTLVNEVARWLRQCVIYSRAASRAFLV